MAGEHSNGNNGSLGNGWRSTLLGALWGVLLLIMGWVATDASTKQAEMSRDIAALSQRVAISEESNRNMRDSLARIEGVLEDIRRQMQERRAGR